MTQELESAFESVRREFERTRAETARRVQGEVINDLRELLRRFRSYEREEEWIALLLDGAARFGREVALFAVRGNSLELRGARGFPLPESLTVEISTAPALSAAIASKDVVIALQTPGEFGAALPSSEGATRVFVAPILNGSRVVALLVATQTEGGDTEGLELVTGIASMVLERHSNTAAAVQIGPVVPPVAKQENERRLPGWADLSEEDRILQVRAQRFARIKVAELQLAHPDAARAGLEQNNVYLFLKSGIDAARESYRAQFVRHGQTIDYLHLELVRIAAEGDEMKLGDDYPGPLV